MKSESGRIWAGGALVALWVVVLTGCATQPADTRPAAGEERQILHAPEEPVSEPFVLHEGESIHAELTSWAERQGWRLLWRHSSSWTVLRETVIEQPDAVAAVSDVIETLHAEGRPVSLQISEGNKVMEIVSYEVRSDFDE